MIAMAWRSLYAETVKARMDDKTLNMKRAIWTWARLTLFRVKAYGNKWYKWYVKQRLRSGSRKKTKTIPEHEYRKYILIEFGPQGDYYISSKLRKLFTESRDDLTVAHGSVPPAFAGTSSRTSRRVLSCDVSLRE